MKSILIALTIAFSLNGQAFEMSDEDAKRLYDYGTQLKNGSNTSKCLSDRDCPTGQYCHRRGFEAVCSYGVPDRDNDRN